GSAGEATSSSGRTVTANERRRALSMVTPGRTIGPRVVARRAARKSRFLVAGETGDFHVEGAAVVCKLGSFLDSLRIRDLRSADERPAARSQFAPCAAHGRTARRDPRGP